MASPKLRQPKYVQIQRDLITANHILHFYGIVDGFGHVSVRHPENPAIYLLCGYMPPALVESADDLIEYWVDGSDPVDPNAKKGYSERFIHGELFKRFPEINCVVHSHAEAVIPFATGTVPLVPLYHMGGFLQGPVRTWDASPLYGDEARQDMLVNTVRLGSSLASAFGDKRNDGQPERNVVLMKHHGFTTFGKDIATACYRGVYTRVNASIQTNAIVLQTAARTAGNVDTASVESLSARHARDCQTMTEATQDKSWRLWSREVQAQQLYVNRT